MASPTPVSQTTLYRIVKELQFISQEIIALQQQRVARVQHAEAVAEEQQLQIDALEAQLSSRINTNKGWLNSIEAFLVTQPADAAVIGEVSQQTSTTHRRNVEAAASSRLMISSSSSAAAAAPPPFLIDSHAAATTAVRSKRSFTSKTCFRGEDPHALSAHAAYDGECDSKDAGTTAAAASSAAPRSPRNKSTASYHGISYDEASSDVDRDCDNKEEVDGEDYDYNDGDDNGGEGGGKDSIAMSMLAAAPSSAANVAIAPASATGEGATAAALVSQAASAAWTAAIAAARARIALIATFEARKSSADEARGALSSVVKQAATSTLSITAAASRLADATAAVTSSGISVGHLQRNNVDSKDPRYSLTMTWANAAQAAEDAALRWAAAADVAHDPAPAQLGAAVEGAYSFVSQAAAAALTAAVAATRVRVDLVRHLFTGTPNLQPFFRDAKRGLFTAECRLAIANPSEADSRLAEATSVVASAHKSVSTLKNTDPNYSLAMTWANVAEAAEDAALRWAAAADVARDPVQAQLDTADGDIASLVSQAATTAWRAAVAAARVRVELMRHLNSANTTGNSMGRLREAKRVLFTVEYCLAIANPSTAAAKSRLSEAKAALFSAQKSSGNVNRAGSKCDDIRTLATTWLKATEEAVEAAEEWVAAAEAQAPPQRLSKRKR